MYTLLAEEKYLEAGVQIRYYETPVEAKFTEGNWHVETIGKGTHMRIICKQLIDCTGIAFMTSLAGFKVLRVQETQPGTLMFKIGGYDEEKLESEMIETRYNEAIKSLAAKYNGIFP